MKAGIILLMLLTLAVSHAASAENRVALVVGNAKYETGDVLPNDVNDANDMAAILKQHDFKVILKTDADLSEMLGGLNAFAQELQQGGVGLFYFSGHGMEVDGKQYIAPTDAKIKSKLDLPHRMIDVNDILKLVGEGKTQLNMIILDACRNNPFKKALGLKGYGNGIGAIPNPPSGSLIASATAAGDYSSAAGERNSVYTKYLLKFLREKPTDEVRLLLGDVGEAVIKATEHGQVPWTNNSMTGRFYFAAPSPSVGAMATGNLTVADDALARLKAMDAERESIYKRKGSSESYYSENCPKHMAFWQQEAQQGQAIAQLLLGSCYHFGKGIIKDDSQAVAWYRKAAEQGHAYGQFNLGLMYANGQGIVKDEVQAVAWYRKAAEQGDAAGQSNLGLMYANGLGIAKEEVQAVAWYRKAAEQGLATGQYNLGFMYENGQGIAKDEAQAVAWYRKAAEQGDADAQDALKRLSK